MSEAPQFQPAITDLPPGMSVQSTPTSPDLVFLHDGLGVEPTEKHMDLGTYNSRQEWMMVGKGLWQNE